MKILLGKKIGMTRVFSDYGEHVPVTVVKAGPCYISQIKTKETDGYDALQVGFEEQRESRTSKAVQGHFAKASMKPFRYVKEFRLRSPSVEKFDIGQKITVSTFSVGEIVNVAGKSKGKGHAGVMKRHGFSGAQKTHGQKDRWRSLGSIGNASNPSRVFPGKKMAGRMGGVRIFVKNLDVVKLDEEKNLLFLKGSVPGARNGLLEIVFSI